MVNLDFYFVLRINKSYAQNMNAIRLRPDLSGARFAKRHWESLGFAKQRERRADEGAQKYIIVVLATTIFDLVTPFHSSFYTFVL